MLYKRLFLTSDIVHNSVTIKKDVSNINDLLINYNNVRLTILKEDKKIRFLRCIHESFVSKEGYISLKIDGELIIDFIPEPGRSKGVNILILYK